MQPRAVAIRHVSFENLGLLGPLLAERGYIISYRDAGIDPITPAIALDAELLVVLGGPIGVHEVGEYPFLEQEQRAIAARLEAGLPTLGICLGAQLIADALGADVKATGRKEIGYGSLTLTTQGRSSVLAPLEGIPVLHWHGDAFTIPAGAERLAETPGYPNQAFSFGHQVLGLQFHLEADHTQIERWLIGHACELAGAGVEPTRIRRDARTHGPALAEAATRVLNAWLDQI